MKIHEKLQNWENTFNKTVESEKLNNSTIKNMLRENNFSKSELGKLLSDDKDFSEQLQILSENSISAFELLSVIVGKNDFLNDFENIYFYGFDIENFDNNSVFE